MKLIISLILVLITTVAFAGNACETHEQCNVNQTCACTVPAYSNYERYYYYDFPALQKGHIYQCELNDSLGIIMGVLEKSTFPAGTKWQLQSHSTHTPMILSVDTNGQEQSSDKMIIKYFVPGSDMPTDTSASCTTLV
jgi:hypothetical protein